MFVCVHDGEQILANMNLKSTLLLTFCNAKNVLLCLCALFVLAKNGTRYPEVEKCTSDTEFLNWLGLGISHAGSEKPKQAKELVIMIKN